MLHIDCACSKNLRLAQARLASWHEHAQRQLFHKKWMSSIVIQSTARRCSCRIRFHKVLHKHRHRRHYLSELDAAAGLSVCPCLSS
jgi:hypothetical protein